MNKRTYLISVYDLETRQVVGTNEFTATRKHALLCYQETIKYLQGSNLQITLFHLVGSTWKGIKKHVKKRNPKKVYAW